jgi:signal transduction histidine kinase
VVAEFGDLAASQGREIELERAPSRVLATADPGAVARIIGTLLENALRYSEPGTPIHVSTRRDGREVAVSVQDTGPGVRPDQRDVIFERFARAATPGSPAGVGLGLPIGRELARRMGGELRLANGSPGACFVLTLPAGIAAAAVPAAAPGMA